MTSTSGEFETALRRLEEIVAKLERENVGLDESVALFKEGKTLALRCERLLKDAQSSIESSATAGSAPAPTPNSTTATPTTRTSAGSTSLFARSAADDAEPDL